jgi:hypothetical protein
MNLDQERAAIETRFLAQWMTGSPAALRTPVGMSGHSFEPPVGESSIRLTIRDGDSFNGSVGSPGSNLVRNVGVLFLEVFTPGGQGDKAARDLADLIEPIFTNWRSGNLLFRTMGRGVPDETEPFYKLPLTFAFQRDTFTG